MRYRLTSVIIAILLVGLVLSGCDVISQWIDGISAGEPNPFISATVGFSLQGNVARSDAQAQAPVSETRILNAAFQATGAYDPNTRTFTATWDGGSYSDTYMEIRLNLTEDAVDHFEVRQTRTDAASTRTEVYEIAGHSVSLFISTSTFITFLVDGTTTTTSISAVEYREWSADGPFYRLVPPQLDNIWSNTSSYIEIRLDR